MEAARSQGPVILANLFASLYPENKRGISIMDVAAGTGRAGEQVCMSLVMISLVMLAFPDVI